MGEYCGSFAEPPLHCLSLHTYGSCGDCSGADACMGVCMCVNVPGTVVMVSDGERFASMGIARDFLPRVT